MWPKKMGKDRSFNVCFVPRGDEPFHKYPLLSFLIKVCLICNQERTSFENFEFYAPPARYACGQILKIQLTAHKYKFIHNNRGENKSQVVETASADCGDCVSVTLLILFAFQNCST